MKIKVKDLSYEEVLRLEPYKNTKPVHQGLFWRRLLKTASARDLKKTNFRCEMKGMEKLGDEPALYLMNHSSFIDLEIAATVIYPRPFHIVCTLDGFVGKEKLMRTIGCIPTYKFMTDIALVRDMKHAAAKLGESIVLYPEASYTFDGTATPLPDTVGKCIKMLGIPVVMIRTYGAFHRDPLYNGLQIRDVDVSAEMSYVLSADDITRMGTDEINSVIRGCFTFDNFRWQQENDITVDETFRADGLHRVLYRCRECGCEGRMEGKGTRLKCAACGAEWELSEKGVLIRLKGRGGAEGRVPSDRSGVISAEASETLATAVKAIEPEQLHIPDWYAEEREEVRREIEAGEYRMELPVTIMCLVDTKAVYRVGKGTLAHDCEGFTLTGCGGALEYHQEPYRSYSLYADYYWYEIGDMISIGTPRIQYYCFPDAPGANVAKARLAAEEMYKLSRSGRAASQCK